MCLFYNYTLKMKLQFGFAVIVLVQGVVSTAVKKHDKFDLVGFAKTNPFGETTGGKAGATTTVTNAQALVTALAVCVTYTSYLRIGTNLSRVTRREQCMFRETLTFRAV